MTWRLHDVKVIKANIIKSSFPLTRWPRPDWSLHPPGCLHWQSWSCSNRALKTKIWALSDAELTWIYHFYHLSAERYPSPLWWIIYVETKWVPENDERLPEVECMNNRNGGQVPADNTRGRLDFLQRPSSVHTTERTLPSMLLQQFGGRRKQPRLTPLARRLPT